MPPFYLRLGRRMRTNKGHMIRHNECRQIAAVESERAQWFGEKGTLLMARAGVHPDTWHPRYGKAEPAKIPNYWMSEMLPPNMRHESGHGGSAVFIKCPDFGVSLVSHHTAEVQ